jgi:Na+-translocating ferredoxin:NAD+ oxidoreductase RnfD subunit
MSTQFLTVSPSPHIHSNDTVQKLMYGVVVSLIPALLISFFVFGLNSLYVMSLSVLFCMGTEYVLTRFLLKQEPTVTDGSAIITGILLGFNVPASLPWWALLIGSIVAIGVGKTAFGGLGNNPFNPALVGKGFSSDLLSGTNDQLAHSLCFKVSVYRCSHRRYPTSHYQRGYRCRKTNFRVDERNSILPELVAW